MPEDCQFLVGFKVPGRLEQFVESDDYGGAGHKTLQVGGIPSTQHSPPSNAIGVSQSGWR